jgi:asparagine N-glycosylation enzyme membrane subunit Stt3
MHEKIKIIALLILATGITFILRLLTLFLLSSGDIPQVLTPDPWYIIRQIDLASHIPCAYTWFDPFTSYPDGALFTGARSCPFLDRCSPCGPKAQNYLP